MKLLKILYGDDAGGVFICEQNYIKYRIAKSIKVDTVIIGDGKAVSKYEEISSSAQKISAPYMGFSGSGISKISQVIKSYNLSKKIADKIDDNNYDAIIFRRPKFMVIVG